MATARAAELGAMSKQSGSSYQGDFFRSPHTALDALPQALLDLQPDSPHFDRVLFRHTQVGWFACLLAVQVLSHAAFAFFSAMHIFEVVFFF